MVPVERRGGGRHGLTAPLPGGPPTGARGVSGCCAPADTEEALAWYDGEKANVVAATRQAAAAGLHEIAWRLPAALFPLFNRRSNWADCVTTLRVAVESGRSTGGGFGEALVLYQLGWALARLRDETAFGYLERSLAIRTELGDTMGEAQAAIGLGEGYLKIRGPGAEALRYMRLAVDLLRPTGASSMRGVALNNLGEVYWELGDPDAAAECYAQARDIYHEVGGHTEGHVLHNLARVYLHLGRIDDAIACLAGRHAAASPVRGSRRRGDGAQAPGAGVPANRRRGPGAGIVDRRPGDLRADRRGAGGGTASRRRYRQFPQGNQSGNGCR